MIIWLGKFFKRWIVSHHVNTFLLHWRVEERFTTDNTVSICLATFIFKFMLVRWLSNAICRIFLAITNRAHDIVHHLKNALLGSLYLYLGLLLLLFLMGILLQAATQVTRATSGWVYIIIIIVRRSSLNVQTTVHSNDLEYFCSLVVAIRAIIFSSFIF